MKTLLVLRHAKAEEASVGQLDFDRDLTKRGKSDAEAVGKYLLNNELVPNAVIASAAKRTRKTAKRVAEAMQFTEAVIETSDLYDAGLQQIVEVVHHIPETAESALIVGHNPGVSDFVSKFGATQTSFPTATVALLKLPIVCWNDLALSTTGELVSLWRPQSE